MPQPKGHMRPNPITGIKADKFKLSCDLVPGATIYSFRVTQLPFSKVISHDVPQPEITLSNSLPPGKYGCVIFTETGTDKFATAIEFELKPNGIHNITVTAIPQMWDQLLSMRNILEVLASQQPAASTAFRRIEELQLRVNDLLTGASKNATALTTMGASLGTCMNSIGQVQSELVNLGREIEQLKQLVERQQNASQQVAARQDRDTNPIWFMLTFLIILVIGVAAIPTAWWALREQSIDRANADRDAAISKAQYHSNLAQDQILRANQVTMDALEARIKNLPPTSTAAIPVPPTQLHLYQLAPAPTPPAATAPTINTQNLYFGVPAGSKIIVIPQ